MRLKNVLFLWIFLIGLVSACGYEYLLEDDSLTCYLTDYYTGAPLEDVEMTFDMATGGGFLGSGEKEKYSAVSNSDGSFTLNDLGYDIKYTFAPNFIRPEDFDSTHLLWKYFIVGSYDDSLWVAKGYNTNIRLKPAGIVIFKHPVTENPSTQVDTIMIMVYNQTVLLSRKKEESEHLLLLPSQEHTIDAIYIKNGIRSVKTFKRYISAAYEEYAKSWHSKTFVIQVPE